MEGTLSPSLILTIVAAYFLLLMVISYFTGRNASDSTFFLANRRSAWYLVAFGMVGASLSGVTFISIPGAVGAGGTNQAFSYMQIVFGYLLGYFVVANVLLPVYYRLNLTTIYSYLEKRLGFYSHKTGSFFFLLSRTIGASFRLYLVAIVLQRFVMDAYGVPFWLTVLTTIILIWIYTYRGGIKTIVITDTLQTFCMLTAVALTIVVIARELGTGISDLPALISQSEYGQMFFFKGGWGDTNYFWKQFISGALITIVMTGLDQDMMQKNLSCRNIREAKKNMYSLAVVLVFVNILFLSLGAMLYIYAAREGISIPDKSDQLYPAIALQHLPASIGILFVLGLIAAAYSSADSALTSLTTSFCIDFLGFEKRDDKRNERNKRRVRYMVHVGFLPVAFCFPSVF